MGNNEENPSAPLHGAADESRQGFTCTSQGRLLYLTRINPFEVKQHQTYRCETPAVEPNSPVNPSLENFGLWAIWKLAKTLEFRHISLQVCCWYIFSEKILPRLQILQTRLHTF